MAQDQTARNPGARPGLGPADPGNFATSPVARHFLPWSLPLVAWSAGFDSRQGPPAGAQGSSKLPPSVYCDPEWLAADLLGYISDTLNRDLLREFVDRNRALPGELDADCDFHLDYALDTAVSVSSDEQVFIELTQAR